MLIKKFVAITYRAPEVFRLEDWDEKVDIWALGCTMYEILYGQQLFPTQSSDSDYLDAINHFFQKPTKSTTFVKPAKTINIIDKIISSCLQFDSNNRATAIDLLTNFFDFTIINVNIIKIKKGKLDNLELNLYQTATSSEDDVVKDFIYRLLLIIKNYNNINIITINIVKIIIYKMLNLNYVNKIDNYINLELDLITKLDHKYYPF